MRTLNRRNPSSPKGKSISPTPETGEIMREAYILPRQVRVTPKEVVTYPKGETVMRPCSRKLMT